MNKKKLVIALGGNALGNTPEEQLELVKHTAKTIVDLSEEGYQVIIGHGNGPQIGMINKAMTNSASNGGKTPYMPFPECGAMSQGYIGYNLMQSIKNELNNRKLDKDVVCVVTQVIVDQKDAAFQNPTKPIGGFLTKEESEEVTLKKGYKFVEDAGRGYRRVVPSPKPQSIVELRTVQKLVDSGDIVITVGGGGIPVVKTTEGFKGIEAVIDKDFACSKLALDLHADSLVILTAVDRVCVNFNKPDEKELAEINTKEILKYIEEGQFAPGSMLPKVQACLAFVEANPESTALITSLERAKDALVGQTGTIIRK